MQSVNNEKNFEHNFVFHPRKSAFAWLKQTSFLISTILSSKKMLEESNHRTICYRFNGPFEIWVFLHFFLHLENAPCGSYDLVVFYLIQFRIVTFIANDVIFVMWIVFIAVFTYALILSTSDCLQNNRKVTHIFYQLLYLKLIWNSSIFGSPMELREKLSDIFKIFRSNSMM